MPAVAIVADIIISDFVATEAAAVIGTEILGSTLAATVVEAAIGGAVGGAASAAIQGGDIWKGAEQGAISAGVSSGVSTEVGDLLKGTNLSPEVQKAISGGVGRTASAVATGAPLKTALEEGAITGAVDYAIPSKGKGDYTSALERSLLGSGLQSALGIGAPRNVRGGGSPFITGSASKQAGSTPGSAALGQALNVGDAGSPIFGSKGDEKSKKNVWNVQSLRYMGQPEESSSG